jgi:HAMP domain-containing protein
LYILVATVAFLWVRGTERAIERADRAEEVAALEHAIAEQAQQLEAGVSVIERSLVEAANGRYSALVPDLQHAQLWRIGRAVNNLFSRVQRYSKYEYEYRRTEQEVQRLVEAIQAAKRGSPPLWPAPSGTPVDLIIYEITGGYQGTQLDTPYR